MRTHSLALTLYRNAVYWAGGGIYQIREGDNIVVLDPRNAHDSAYLQARFMLGYDAPTDPVTGWETASCSVIVDGVPAGASDCQVKPVTFYVHEVTDWHTGIVRFIDVYPQTRVGPRRLGVGAPVVEQLPPPVWTLTVRRAA